MKVTVKKLSNKQLMNSALDLIRSWGYTIKDVEMGKDYFVFSGSNNSICHFHIKEIPNFIFAFWNTNRFDSIEYSRQNNRPTFAEYYEIPQQSELVFFTQYEPDLDKFKPSTSGFVTGIYREAYTISKKDNTNKEQKVEEWQAWDLENILEYMKKHKYRSRIYVGSQIDKIYEQISTFEVIRTTIRDNYYRNKYNKIHKKENKMSRKAVIKLCNTLKTYDAYVTECSFCSPRYELKLRPKILKTEKELKLHYKEDILLDKYEDKIWKNKYNKEYCIEYMGIDKNYPEQDYKDWTDRDFKIAQSREKSFFKCYKTIKKEEQQNNSGWHILIQNFNNIDEIEGSTKQ